MVANWWPLGQIHQQLCFVWLVQNLKKKKKDKLVASI